MSKTAVITGATSGIGEAYARRLAKDGYDLIITGRKKDTIQKVADDITQQYKNKVDVVIAEMSDERDVQKLLDVVGKRDDIEYLINNAGYSGYFQCYEQTDFAEHEKMVKAHDITPLRLISAVLPGMKKRKKGVIINVASLAGVIPFYRHAVYAGSKAFLKHYTHTLCLELKGTGVKVQALCPGNVYTNWGKDYYAKEFYDLKMTGKSMPGMSAEKLVAISMKSLNKSNPVCVPGLVNRVFASFVSLLPINTYISVCERMMASK